MYENCAKKFFKNTNIEVLAYLIRALSKANRLAESKQLLLKARHVSPDDTLVMFNLALVQQRLSKQVMQDDRSQLQAVQKAFFDLKAASRTFNWLHGAVGAEAERLREYKCDHEREARICDDLLAQGKYHLARAERLHEEELELKRRQESEIMQLKMRQEQEQLQREQEQEQQKLALIEKRAEFIKKTENFASNFSVHIEKTAKKRSKRETGEIVTSGESGEEGDAERPVKVTKVKAASGKSKSKKRRTNDSSDAESKSESEKEEEVEETASEEEEQEESTVESGPAEGGSDGEEKRVKGHKTKNKKNKKKHKEKTSKL